MPEVSLVLSRAQSYSLRELAEVLAFELTAQGVPASVRFGAFPPPAPAHVSVLMDPWGYRQAEGADALPGDTELRRTVFVCAEPSPEAGDEERLHLLGRAGAVFATDQRAVVSLHRLRIPARLLRPGYSASLDRYDPEAPRPIDVLVLGARTPRRDAQLQRAVATLASAAVHVELADALPDAEDVDAPLARPRWSLLSQAKVLLDVHGSEDARFDWRLALDAIHAGAVVLSEQSHGIAPLDVGAHVFVGSPDALPHLTTALLRDEARLAAARTGAHERLRAWIPYALWVSVLRAAVVEVVGEPLAPTPVSSPAA